MTAAAANVPATPFDSDVAFAAGVALLAERVGPAVERELVTMLARPLVDPLDVARAIVDRHALGSTVGLADGWLAATEPGAVDPEPGLRHSCAPWLQGRTLTSCAGEREGPQALEPRVVDAGRRHGDGLAAPAPRRRVLRSP